MRVGDLAHPRTVQADRRIQQHQRRHQVGAGGRELQRDRAAERVPDHHDRAVGLVLDQRRRGRRRWRRWSTAPPTTTGRAR